VSVLKDLQKLLDELDARTGQGMNSIVNYNAGL